MTVSDTPLPASPDPADAPRRPRPILGILLKVLSALSFTLMAAIVRHSATGGIRFNPPVGQLVFFRSFFALVPVLIWLTYARPLSAAFATKNLKGHIRRGIIGTLGMFLGFAGLVYLPLPDATAISYAAPLLSVLLAAVILKETVRLYRWTAVVIGLFGVIVMLLPHLALGGKHVPPGAATGVWLALGGALCAAVATIEVRRLTATEHTAAIVVYFSLFTTVAALVTFGLGLVRPEMAWHWPGARDFWMLAAIGMLGGIGQILMTHSYRYADASVIAPFDYTSMIWALLIGWLLFGEIPEKLVLIGAVIVIASGVFVILRERQLGIERKRMRRTGPGRPL
ncbi:MAG TPA: DMT family transporter [Beijerinckiaceae bacterium]|nr:DMT family transporter [Beijerinckiaceae bacterium]